MSWHYTWTPEMEAAVRAGFAAGLSASQIALKVAPAAGRPMTRNMVLGKLHRLGLFSDRADARAALGKNEAVRTEPGRPRQKALAIARPVAVLIPPADAPLRAPELMKVAVKGGSPAAEALLALDANACRWPIGDPISAGFRFCGDPRQAGRPYCGAHCKEAVSAFQPKPARAPYDGPARRAPVSFGAAGLGMTRKGAF